MLYWNFDQLASSVITLSMPIKQKIWQYRVCVCLYISIIHTAGVSECWRSSVCSVSGHDWIWWRWSSLEVGADGHKVADATARRQKMTPILVLLCAFISGTLTSASSSLNYRGQNKGDNETSLEAQFFFLIILKRANKAHCARLRPELWT